MQRKSLSCLALIAMVFMFSCKKAITDSEPIPTTPAIDSLKVGLVAYYTFNGGSGADSSGKGNHVYSSNNITATTNRFNISNSAVSFNGVNSYMTVKDNASLRLSNTDFTTNVWIYMEAYNASFGSELLCKRGTGSNNGWNYSVFGNASTNPAPIGSTSLQVSGGLDPLAAGGRAIGLNQWHMLTTVYKTATKTVTFYIDGVLDKSVSGIPTPSSASTVDLYIGADSQSSAYYLKGKLDDIRIYNKALPPSLIQKLYTPGQAPPILPAVDSLKINLIAYYPLNNSGADSSGQGNHVYASNNITSSTNRFNIPNSAVRFDGLSSFMKVKDNADLRLSNTNFSINVWINLEAYNDSFGSEVLCKRGSGSGNGWNYSVFGNASLNAAPIGSTSFQVSGGLDPLAAGGKAISINKWHMLTTLYDLTTQKVTFYIDGVLDRAVTGVPSPSAVAATDLHIGADSQSSAYYLKGSLDEIRIYNRILKPAEITGLYLATN
jgi:hypothetical protein